MEKEKIIQIYRDVLDGRRVRFPNHFFVGDQGKTYLAFITSYLVEEYLGIPIEEIPRKVTAETLWTHRLRSPAYVFGWNFIEVIDNAYPGKFQPWEFNQVSNNYWQGENGRKRAIEAVRFVIEEKCKIPHQEIPLKINHRFFKDHKLNGIFYSFGDSPYQVINTVYPGQFQPWELANVPSNYWKNPENIKQALDWFLFQKLGFSSYEDALMKLQKKDFFQYRLAGLLQCAFDHRLIKVKQWIREQHIKDYLKSERRMN
ncbi:hypothetical protein BBV17_28500 [Cytobacillus oceanisediminis]|uniref:DUF4046 domain-containing protein n=1 Tax=Cytobacillus oceanisediminis TaxID=665099 RepID=A0ABX3CK39_9BACI|nr:hypothetical protein BBV17_28500 [Cytobacillus oceanisediminis]